MNIEKYPDEIKEFISKLFGPLAEKTGDIISDFLDGSVGVKVKLWRYKKITETLLKARLYLHNKGVSPKNVPLKILHPLLEAASLEDNENIQEMWAALLANAADLGNSNDSYRSYIEILKQLNPLEAQLLNWWYECYSDTRIPWERTGFGRKSEFKIYKKDVCSNRDLSPEQFDIIASNLIRLNLLQLPGVNEVAVESEDKKQRFPLVIKTYDFVQLTPMGESFIKSCSYDKKDLVT